jgi:hypothetical protein
MKDHSLWQSLLENICSLVCPLHLVHGECTWLFFLHELGLQLSQFRGNSVAVSNSSITCICEVFCVG